MPQSQRYYEPDAIDCNTLSSSIRQEFGCDPIITVQFALDRVTVTCKCFRYGQPGGDMVQVQALVKAPLKNARSPYTMQYSALLDCWHQLDRGTLAVASKPVERDWNGRPKQPARSQQ